MDSNALYSKLKSALRKKQSPMRFAHSVSVGDWAAELGRAHGWDPERARLTGLLHDYAKEWSPKKLKKYVIKHDLDVPEFDWICDVSPNMLHAYVSADVARRKKWLTNKKEWRAVASHTLARGKMSLEEKIIYVADFSEPNRPYAAAELVRKKALIDIDVAFRDSLAIKIKRNLDKFKPIHPTTVSVWNKLLGG